MENATKALLIAAAVLVVILIISFGVGIFQMGEEATAGMNLSQQEVQAFNQQFDQYAGNGKRGSEVNALIKTVVQSNIKQNAEGNTNRMVSIEGPGITKISGAQATIPTVDTAQVYNVTITRNTTTGLVTSIQFALPTSGGGGGSPIG